LTLSRAPNQHDYAAHRRRYEHAERRVQPDAHVKVDAAQRGHEPPAITTALAGEVEMVARKT
jgi:hypothetical protein